MIYFLFLYNAVRVFILKVRYRTFKASILQRISPSVQIKILGNGSMVLGKSTCISRNSSLVVTNSGSLSIGDKVFMNQNCMISAKSKISIGANCNFGPNVCVFDNDHQYNAANGVSASDYSIGEIHIGSGTWVASNVVILRNTTIGKNCVIGAGCVIKGAIPDNTLVFMERNLIYKKIL
ncbi:MAG: acyltransferase [Flavobacteriaceae bacterium]|nr:acyltransferase [Flavobacteriaceae bacterium]